MSGPLITPAKIGNFQFPGGAKTGNFSFSSVPGSLPSSTPEPEVITGPPGPAGPPGPKGDTGSSAAGAFLTWTAGETVGSPRVIMLDGGFGKLFVPSVEANTSLTMGVSNNSALAGDIVNVITSGELTSSGSFVAGAVYYAGPGGVLVTAPPLTGILLKVGTAKTNSVLAMQLSVPIFQG